ncbi:MAG: glycosyltransferase [Lachnospiraceae bacterium]|nr:glycosyltransferase [Lachnospiraceae bacterium]
MLATTAAMIEQFNKNNIEILRDMGYVVDVAGNFETGNPISDKKIDEFKYWIEMGNGKWIQIPATRNPLDIRGLFQSVRILIRENKKNKYEFLHCHTPVGSVIGRIAGHNMNIPVVYTAHGFHFFKGAPLKNWMIYYPIEKILSRWTDTLILLNQEDYGIAQKKFHSKRVEYIPGVGVNCEEIRKAVIDRNAMRKTLGLNQDDFVIISVGELIKRKNQGIIVETLAEISNPKVKCIICGKGNQKEYLEKLIVKNNLQDRVFLLGFREDIAALCKMSDAFFFPSKQEGLSMAMMEAMAAGMPIIASDIRGNRDLIQDGFGGILVGPDDKQGYVNAVKCLVDNSDIREKMGKNNIVESAKYDRKIIEEKMKKIYEDLID